MAEQMPALQAAPALVKGQKQPGAVLRSKGHPQQPVNGTDFARVGRRQARL